MLFTAGLCGGGSGKISEFDGSAAQTAESGSKR
jgi:hypothetical protein